MYWEQIGFCVFFTGYLMLSLVKTVDRYRDNLRKQKLEKRRRTLAQISPIQIQVIQKESVVEESVEEKKRAEQKAIALAKYRFIKTCINYSVSFNSSFLIVGSLSESFLYGVRMVGNIFSVTLGYVYAFLIVQPFMYSLDDDIKTPYQYFERRYRDNKYIKVITTFAGMLFYLSFLTLYLWGCAVLLSTLIPHAPLWTSSVIVGAYSLIGSTMGGFVQSTKTNLFQFLVLIAGLLCASGLTIVNQRDLTLSQMWQLAEKRKRTVFWDQHVDTSTRYTILNQLTSLSLPWTVVHSMLLPNFMRYRAIKNAPLKSRLLMVSNFPCMVLVNLIILISGGFVMFIYFYGCSPLYTRKIVNKNQLGTYWIYLVLSDYAPSFSGILFASIICYSVVQHSLGISLLSSTVFNEVITPVLPSSLNMSNFVKNKCILCLTVFFSMLSTLYSISFGYVKNTMISLFFVFNNSIHSPILGLFFLSTLNPYANSVGAMTAFLSNYCINFFMALGTVVFNRLKSQEFPPDTFLCKHEYHRNMSSLNVYDQVIPMQHHLNTTHTPSYYPTNPVLAFFFSVAPIWYCLFSVLYTFLMGSLFSLIYSWIKTRSIDVDADFAEKRKQYLYYYRMFKRDQIN